MLTQTATMALDKQRREYLIQTLVRRAAENGVTAPAILFLEMHRPLAFLGAQMLWTAEPFLNGWLGPRGVRDLAGLLEDPEALNELMARLEQSKQDRSPLSPG